MCLNSVFIKHLISFFSPTRGTRSVSYCAKITPIRPPFVYYIRITVAPVGDSNQLNPCLALWRTPLPDYSTDAGRCNTRTHLIFYLLRATKRLWRVLKRHNTQQIAVQKIKCRLEYSRNGITMPHMARN